MKIKIAIILMGLSLVSAAPSPMMLNMSDAQAKSKAISLWGPGGTIDKYWSEGQVGQWVFRVGCADESHPFLITGQGASWEAAFAGVDMTRNGPFALYGTATQTDGQKTKSPTINFYACNALVH